MIELKPSKYWAYNTLLTLMLYACLASGYSQTAVSSLAKTVEQALLNPKDMESLVLKKAPKNHHLDTVLPQLVNLKKLTLNGCKLQQFPTAICQLEQLTELDLGKNDIDTIPDCICKLLQLKTLKLWENNLYWLPNCLNEMPELKTIDLLNMDYNLSEQEKLKARFPNIKLILSPPCACNFDRE